MRSQTKSIETYKTSLPAFKFKSPKLKKEQLYFSVGIIGMFIFASIFAMIFYRALLSI